MKSMHPAGSYPKLSKTRPGLKPLQDELSPGDLEVCQIHYRLWWTARQRNIARLQVVGNGTDQRHEEQV